MQSRNPSEPELLNYSLNASVLFTIADHASNRFDNSQGLQEQLTDALTCFAFSAFPAEAFINRAQLEHLNAVERSGRHRGFSAPDSGRRRSSR